jgi:hypothetical protein
MVISELRLGFWLNIGSTRKGPLNALHQGMRLEGLSKQAKSPAFQSQIMETFFRARCDHDDRYGAFAAIKPLLEFDAAEAGHLNVGDDAPGGFQHSGLQKVFGRFIYLGVETLRAHERGQRYSRGHIIVNNRYLRVFQNRRPLPQTWRHRGSKFACSLGAANHTEVLTTLYLR